jgi:hypothetical protein
MALRRSPSLPGPTSYPSLTSSASPVHSRSQSQPLPSALSARTRSSKLPPIASTTQTNRPRAPSDPFLDSHVPISSHLPSSYSSANTMAQLTISGSSSTDDPSCPPTPQTESTDPFHQPSNELDAADVDGYMRTWIAPDLPNVEYLTLLKVFPAFVVRNPLPRFPITKVSSAQDIEEGIDGTNKIKVGTGLMWISSQTRRSGWKGSVWTRFKLWLRTVFC